MKTLVLCSNPVLGIGVIRCLGVAGHWVCAMGTRKFPFYRMSRYCARYEAFGKAGLCGPGEEMIARINSMVRRHGVEAIVPADLAASMVAGEMGERLGAPLYPLTEPAGLRRLHDKWLFSKFLGENNLPHPRTALVERAEDVAALEIAGPWIVKPRDGDGGVGVGRADAREEIEKRIAAEGRALLVQEFIPGADIDLSFLADRGELVAWTIQTGGPPSVRRVFQAHPRVLEIGRALAAASGYHGVAHVDMRIDERDGTVRVLEINPRFWNTLCHSLCIGVNFADLGIRMMRGELPVAAFDERVGICDGVDLTPWRIMGAVFSAHAPASLGKYAEGMWRLTGSDPLPDLCRWGRRVLPFGGAKAAAPRAGFWGRRLWRYNRPANESLAA